MKSGMNAMLDIFSHKRWKGESVETFREQLMRPLLLEERSYPTPKSRAAHVWEICGTKAFEKKPEMVSDAIEALFVTRYHDAVAMYEEIERIGFKKDLRYELCEGLISGLLRVGVWASDGPKNAEFDERLPSILTHLITTLARVSYVFQDTPIWAMQGAFSSDIAAYLSASGWPDDRKSEANRRRLEMLSGFAGQDWSIARGAPAAMFGDIMHKILEGLAPQDKIRALFCGYLGDSVVPAALPNEKLLRTYGVVRDVHIERAGEERRRRMTLSFASVSDAERFIEYCRIAHLKRSGNGSGGAFVDQEFSSLRAQESPSLAARNSDDLVKDQLEQEDIDRLSSWATLIAETWNAGFDKVPVPVIGTRHGAITFEWERPESLKLPE